MRRFRSPGSPSNRPGLLPKTQVVMSLFIIAALVVSYLLFYTTRTSKSISESSSSFVPGLLPSSPGSLLISTGKDLQLKRSPAVVKDLSAPNPNLPPPPSLRQRDPLAGAPPDFNKKPIHIPVRFDRIRFAKVSLMNDAIGFATSGIQSFGLAPGKAAQLGDEACIMPPPFGTQCTAHAEISMKLCMETPGCVSVTCPDKTPYFGHSNKNIHGPVCQLRGLGAPGAKRSLENYFTATSLESQFKEKKTDALGVVFEGGHGMCAPGGCKNVFFSDELPRAYMISTFAKEIDTALVGIHDYDSNQGIDAWPLLIIPYSQSDLFTDKLKLDGQGRGRFVKIIELKAPGFVEAVIGADASWLYNAEFKQKLRSSPNFHVPPGPDKSSEWQHVVVFREDENADAPLM